ncbi:MAG TPA: L-aspartate oxidase [Roseiflexaceae bacterium]|nr:L-aspartate oxidase [Roseiflexaceae bacterium]
MDLYPIAVDTPRYAVTPPTAAAVHSCDVLVVGGGAAGLAAALRAAEHAEVIVLARGPLRESNSAWAQGGIAAALDGEDSPRFHVADTLTAGAGLCDVAAVEALAYAAPALMRELAGLGVPFEQHGGAFALGLEGGHSQRRILHVGDTTGWAITSALIGQAQRHPHIRILEGYHAAELLTAPTADRRPMTHEVVGGQWPPAEERCIGALALDAEGRWHRFVAGAVVLASGGAGALYGLTSNQPTALGEGIALAYRAGAEVADMEFVQFHPTVYRTRAGSGFLISEAARGEGGLLRTPGGQRFMPAYDARAELAPRDVVTRGIYAAMRTEGADHVLLDLRHLGRAFLERRFPTIVARCRADGLDPATEPIPVAPAAHYLMGGVRTDLQGATTLPGLFAAGECACTGVHGANRLASNSLLECLVFGRRAGAAALRQIADCRLQIADCTPRHAAAPPLVPDLHPEHSLKNGGLQQSWRDELASIMRACAGPLRSAEGLSQASRRLPIFHLPSSIFNHEEIAATNACLTARLIVAGALMRRESRGAHFRSDHPRSEEAWRAHLVQASGRTPRLLAHIADHWASDAVPA